MESAATGGTAQPIEEGLHASRVKLLRFAQHRCGDASRRDVEDYIRDRFARTHGARITHFLPHLVSVGSVGRFCAAVGLAPADGGRLFAETYLHAPIEQLISDARGEPVSRSDILEIGNLVSTWKGGSLVLFVFLSELIDRLGHRFVLFTATREVERLLARLRYAPVVVGDADPGCLPDAGSSWGTYYAQRPRVMFGEVGPAVAAARRDVVYRAAAAAIRESVERIADELRSGFGVELMARALRRLRAEALQGGRIDMFDRLERYLTREPAPGQYAALATELGTQPLALVVAVKRLRQRFREIVDDELAHTVASAEDLAAERAALLGLLAGGAS